MNRILKILLKSSFCNMYHQQNFCSHVATSRKEFDTVGMWQRRSLWATYLLLVQNNMLFSATFLSERLESDWHKFRLFGSPLFKSGHRKEIFEWTDFSYLHISLIGLIKSMNSDLLLDDGCGLQSFRRLEYLIEIGKFLRTAKNAER